MRTQTIDLNLIPGSISPTIHLTQYDKDAGALVFNVYGEPGFFIPPNSTATITGTKPDGYGFSYSATIRDNVVTANVTQQMTAVPGIVKCELRITKDNDDVGSQLFYLDVKAAALNEDTIISDSDLSSVAMAEQYAASAAQSAGDAASLVDLLNGLGRGTYTIARNVSVNAIVEPGFYYLSTSYGITDIPEGVNGNLWVYNCSNSNVIQIFRRLGNPGTDDSIIYIRRINTTGTDTQTWWQYIDSNGVDTKVNTRLPIAGGTMTGDLIIGNKKSVLINDPDVTIGTNPSSNKTSPGILYRDSANVVYGQLRAFYLTNGSHGLVFNGAGNYLRIGIDGSNVPYVYVNNKDAWRTALGISGKVKFLNANVFTLESGYTLSNNRVWLYVHDNIVTLGALLRGPVVAGTNTKIATLNSTSGAINYKPKYTVDFAVGSSVIVRGFINTAGELNINGPEAASNPYLAINCSWCLDD